VSKLLRAGIDEKPPGASVERTLAALGAAGATLGAAAGGAAAATAKGATLLSLGVIAKWGGVGVLAGLAVALASHVAEKEPKLSAPSAVGSTALPALTTAQRDPRAPASPTASASAPERLAPASNAPPSIPARSLPSADAAPLAAEVAFVDRGRVAFQRGDGDAALTALDRYERAFPDRRLMPEVLYLRMEARLLLGDTARATGLARLILRDFAQSPHAVRARAILGEQ
jgi:hypothetical protein